MIVPIKADPAGRHRNFGTAYAISTAPQSGGARMDQDESNRNHELRAEVLRLLDECRNLLELTETLAKRLQGLTDRLPDDQVDRRDAAD
jgi:hypothetical protein